MKAKKLSPWDVPDIQAGRQLAKHFQIPYVVVEFHEPHDLAHMGKTYELPQSYVDNVRRLAGVSELIVLPSENKYAGQGKVFLGRGSKILSDDGGSTPRNLRGGACQLLALPKDR